MVTAKPTLTFPILDLEQMSKEDKRKLHQTLYSESFEIMCKFQDLFSSTVKSFKDRKIHSKHIVSHLMVLGPVEPAYEDLGYPVLRRILPGLRNKDDTDEVMYEINYYCSYFNFHMLERIIDKLGTEKDKANLTRYKAEFCNYAERHVFMCPSEVGAVSEGRAKMFVTLDETYDNCTLSHLEVFNAQLRKILNISDIELQLCRIKPGSVKLTFQIPLDLQQIFPLSKDQEMALTKIGILQLSCGDYVFNKEVIQVSKSVLDPICNKS